MRNHFALLAAIAATTFAIVMQQAGAQAAPRGWKCEYSVTPIGIGPYRRYSRNYLYACYGRSLRKTRARARRRCRRLASCVTGACFPLDFRPRRRCEREH